VLLVWRLLMQLLELLVLALAWVLVVALASSRVCKCCCCCCCCCCCWWFRITIPGIKQHRWFRKPLAPLYQEAMNTMSEQQASIDKQVRTQQRPSLVPLTAPQASTFAMQHSIAVGQQLLLLLLLPLSLLQCVPLVAVLDIC
jgi:hypothetical protein